MRLGGKCVRRGPAARDSGGRTAVAGPGRRGPARGRRDARPRPRSSRAGCRARSGRAGEAVLGDRIALAGGAQEQLGGGGLVLGDAGAVEQHDRVLDLAAGMLPAALALRHPVAPRPRRSRACRAPAWPACRAHASASPMPGLGRDLEAGDGARVVVLAGRWRAGRARDCSWPRGGRRRRPFRSRAPARAGSRLPALLVEQRDRQRKVALMSPRAAARSIPFGGDLLVGRDAEALPVDLADQRHRRPRRCCRSRCASALRPGRGGNGRPDRRHRQGPALGGRAGRARRAAQAGKPGEARQAASSRRFPRRAGGDRGIGLLDQGADVAALVEGPGAERDEFRAGLDQRRRRIRRRAHRRRRASRRSRPTSRRARSRPQAAASLPSGRGSPNMT